MLLSWISCFVLWIPLIVLQEELAPGVTSHVLKLSSIHLIMHSLRVWSCFNAVIHLFCCNCLPLQYSFVIETYSFPVKMDQLLVPYQMIWATFPYGVRNELQIFQIMCWWFLRETQFTTEKHLFIFLNWYMDNGSCEDQITVLH